MKNYLSDDFENPQNYPLQNSENNFNDFASPAAFQEGDFSYPKDSLPSYLTDWYRQGYSEALSPPQIPAFAESYGVAKPAFAPQYSVPQNQIKKNPKKILKQTLQILTLSFLFITAVSVGGFIFLDRKVNLSATNESLQNMSQDLMGGKSATNLSASVSSLIPKTEVKAAATNSPIVPNISKTAIPAKQDSDNDGLSDEVEEKLATNPYSADTDGDGYSDGEEVKNGYDPLVPATQKNPAAVLGDSTNNPAPSCQTSAATGETSGSGCGVPSSTNSTASTANIDFSSLSTDDYSALQNFGLTDQDVSKITSGGATEQDRAAMQEKILSSSPVKDGIQNIFNNAPKAPLPTINEENLNLYNSEKKEDVQKYLGDVNSLFDRKLGPLKNLDSQTIQNQVFNNDYTAINSLRQALQGTYDGLADLRAPSAARDAHLAFLTLLQFYLDVTNTQNLSGDDSEISGTLISNLKSSPDIQAKLAESLQGLVEKYQF